MIEGFSKVLVRCSDIDFYHGIHRIHGMDILNNFRVFGVFRGQFVLNRGLVQMLRGAEIIEIPFATADNWKRIAPNFAELRRTDNRMIQSFSAIFWFYVEFYGK
jgi:hypothetical protein